MGIDVQVVKEIEVAMEGEGVTEVPHSRSHPVQLSSVQAEDTSGLVTVPAKASSASTASWFTLSAPYNSNLTSNLPTTSFPRSFTHPIARCSASFPSERHNVQHPVLPPFHSIPTTQKRPSKRRFGPSPLSLPTTPSFQRQSPIFHSIHSPSDTLEPYQDERRSFKGPLSPSTLDNVNNTFSPMHNTHPMSPSASSHDLYSYSPSARSRPSTPSPPNRRSSSLPPTLRRLENCCGQQLLRSQPSIPLVSE